MDDANVPSLLGLPYLESSPDAALYARTRAVLCGASAIRGSFAGRRARELADRIWART